MKKLIKEIHEKDIAECVNVIRESFLTVADELGFTVDNAPLTCGYMKKYL